MKDTKAENILASSDGGNFFQNMALATIAAATIFSATHHFSSPQTPQEKANDVVADELDEQLDEMTEDYYSRILDVEVAIKIGLMEEDEYKSLIDDIRMMQDSSASEMNIDYGDNDADAYYGKRHKRTRPSLEIDDDTGDIGILMRAGNTSSRRYNKYVDLDQQTITSVRPHRALGEEIYQHFELPEVEQAYKEKYGRDIGAEMRIDDVVMLMKEMGEKAFAAEDIYSNYSELSTLDFKTQMKDTSSQLNQVISKYVIDNTELVLERNNEIQTEIIQSKFKELGNQVEDARANFKNAVSKVTLTTTIGGDYFSSGEIKTAINRHLSEKKDDLGKMNYKAEMLMKYMNNHPTPTTPANGNSTLNSKK